MCSLERKARGRCLGSVVGGGSRGGWCGPVECGVTWSGRSGFERPRFPRASGEVSMLSRSPEGVRGGMVVVAGNSGGPC